MKRKHKIIIFITVILTLLAVFSTSAFALTESEVQAAIDEHGADTVNGNIFVWFLCAIAFLKVSQKIDSFMASLGVNVGHTGGSMLAEAAIAARGLFTAKQFAGGFGKGSGGSSSGGSSGNGGGGFTKGGIVGMVGRGISNSGVKKATGKSNGGLGGKVYTSSVGKGGSFATSVIGRVATGNISSMGTISGEGSSEALACYLGHTAMGDAEGIPTYSDVEIGGGHIMATEESEEHPDGIEVAMYHTEQYMKPSGEHTVITTADGEKWYKQYARDTVERTPHAAPNGMITYSERVVKKLLNPPKRKDRV